MRTRTLRFVIPQIEVESVCGSVAIPKAATSVYIRREYIYGLLPYNRTLITVSVEK